MIAIPSARSRACRRYRGIGNLAERLAFLAIFAHAGSALATEPRISFGGPPGHQTLYINGEPARYDPEAERLISRLDLSEGMRQVARDYVAVEMARGIAARPAVEGWVLMKRREGIVVRCTRISRTTVECVIR